MRDSRMYCTFIAMAWASVRVFVRLSHCCIVSKRCKLRSRNLHCRLPQGLFFSDEISFLWVKGFPSNEYVKAGVYPKHYFAAIGSFNVKTVADKHSYSAYYI